MFRFVPPLPLKSNATPVCLLFDWLPWSPLSHITKVVINTAPLTLPTVPRVQTQELLHRLPSAHILQVRFQLPVRPVVEMAKKR